MASVAEEIEATQGGALQTAKDLFSGAVGGVAQVLIGKCRLSLRSASAVVRVKETRRIQWEG